MSDVVEHDPPRPRRELDLTGLNPAQYEAVTLPPGPILVVAGAGSGKTRVLTHRLAYLVAELGASPFEVLAITFTNKAAGEMRERVAELVGPVGRRMWVSTFHAACSRILRREASLLGYRPSFTIYDQADAVRLTDWVRRDLDLDPKRFPARQLHQQISGLKNELVLPGEFALMASGPAEKRLADVYTEYQRRLADASAVDFDDLLVLAVRLFREHPEALERYRQRFRHVLVDEFQDTNAAQWELVRAAHRRAPQRHGRRRPRPVDLQVSGSGFPEPVEVRGGVPGGGHGRARPELPLDATHSRRGQRGDREQRVAPAEAPVDRSG